jgi:formylglycine-generating enzyme required for sulfatase activity
MDAMLRRLLLAVLLCFPAVSLAADLPLGLVPEKPASGPFVETKQGFMVPYKATIPGTEAEYEMIPIPGGKFKLGSPATEKDRKEDEGPQVEVEVAPFWMGKHEVTWSEYKTYMAMHNVFKEMSAAKIRLTPRADVADVVTAPSNLYDPTFTYSKGSEPRQPAISMSQYAAKQYTKWLSGIAQRFYRLPTEAEWEYACRAGTTTAYSFGDDPAQLADHAWTFENASEVTHPVGTKKPNPWGLHDMHGNVAEWVLDGYADHYPDAKGKTLSVAEALVTPAKLYPRVVRGGSYDDKPAACRSAARKQSDDDDWREQDPNFPQSPWWFTSNYGLCVGMRLVRPLDVPARGEQDKFWKADLPQIVEDVNRRIDEEGRGARGVSDPSLLKDMETFRGKK